MTMGKQVRILNLLNGAVVGTQVRIDNYGYTYHIEALEGNKVTMTCRFDDGYEQHMEVERDFFDVPENDHYHLRHCKVTHPFCVPA